MENKTWYAIYTKSRNEKKVKTFMEERGYTVYLPLIKTLKQWSDRKKRVEVPLIPSYVFVQVSENEYYEILNTPGVVGYVTFEGKAAPIRASQIKMLQSAVEGDQSIELANEHIKKGQQVKIVSGPMKGAQGDYLETKNKGIFIIDLSNIGFSLKVEVNAENVIKL